jgi:TonB family protein
VSVPIPEVPLGKVSTIADLLEGQYSGHPSADLGRLELGNRASSSDSVPLSESAVDEPVAVIRQPAPEYPPALAHAGIAGRVEVQYIVDTTGVAEPSSVRVLSSTHPAFEAAARASVAASRFRPARLHGRAVRQLVRQALTFRVRD